MRRLTRRFQFFEEYQERSVTIRATPSDSAHIDAVSILFDGRVVAEETRRSGEAVELTSVLVFN